MDTFEAFITANAGADTARLLLSCKEWPESESPFLKGLDPKNLAVSTIDSRRKLSRKVPEWASEPSLVYPRTLSAEQCSSTATAIYKATLAERIANENSSTGSDSLAADLTGGLGVDSWAFSSRFSEVLYNEMDPSLVSAARHNFSKLKVSNIRFSNKAVEPGNLGEVLEGVHPAIIFMDPARRDSAGKKVFLLEDCSPDVLKLIPEMFEACRHILLKISPMADITMAAERLCKAALACSGYPAGRGRCIREIHIVSAGSECKELLIWMDREYDGRFKTVCCEDGNVMELTHDDSLAEAQTVTSTYLQLLFEPGKSLTKAGMFSAIGKRFSLASLARFTHLYTPTRVLSEAEIQEEAARLRRFGKVYRVEEVLPLDKASIKDVGKRFPHSEVSAKNIPMSSDELRSKLKVSSGDNAHIFGARIELPSGPGNHIIICKPLR